MSGLHSYYMSLMKNISLFACILLLAACSRKDPVTATPGVEVTTLKPIASIDLLPHIPEPSGLAYHPGHNALLVVSDAKSDIFEIGLDGALIRTLATTSSDLEGVAVSAGGDTLYVAEERNQLITLYSSAGVRLHSLPVRVATLDNNALEGVAVDRQNHLWVLNEKNPRLLLQFHNGQEVSRVEITHVNDLSDICCDTVDESLWIISDESRKIIKIARNGNLLGEWALSFDKGEGIAFAGDKMYVVNDQDGKLYIFSRPQ